MSETTTAQQQAVNGLQEPETHLPEAPAGSAPGQGIQDLLFNTDAMNHMERLANLMARGKATVPQHLQGNPGDCMAVVMQAAQWRMNPFAVAQKTHLVNGTLGYEAQLVNAVITSMAPTENRLEYEWYGPWENVIGKFEVRKNNQGKEYQAPAWSFKDEKGCGIQVWATLKGEEEPRVLDLLLTQAQVRNSTLWASDPKQQLAYLAIKRWSRLYCPDVILGVYTPDEMSSTAARSGEKTVGGGTAGGTARGKDKLRQRRQKRGQTYANEADEPKTVNDGQSQNSGTPGPGGKITCAYVCEQIQKAQNKEQLDEAADMARHLPEKDKSVARHAYEGRVQQLRQQSESS
ncbi:RecT family recombinase [Kushneria aurantia]|uniref:RecT family recombinase n=1 Tax=Kushneria aurantia TaxID=504092 RepID=A0ABV6G4H0_9GAMM|nr:RecT family recombinase [Kushneria aurantia]